MIRNTPKFDGTGKKPLVSEQKKVIAVENQEEYYESIDDIARGEGFIIDDDGHWIPLEEALDFGYEPEDLDLDFCIDDSDYDDDSDS